MAAADGAMKQILKFDNDSKGKPLIPVFDAVALKNIIDNIKINDIVVISIGGPKNTGKSFLINLMISKLAHLQTSNNGDPWMNSDKPLDDLAWGRGTDSVTKGIWISSTPFLLIPGTRKKEIAVLLLDCEGLYDANEHAQFQTAIVTLFALELSKIHIFNVHGGTHSTHLEHLQSCISRCANSGLEYIFQTLILLHRDWDDDNDYGSRDMVNGGPQEEALREAFVDITEYMLPVPGSIIRKGSSGLTLREISASRNEDTELFRDEVSRFLDHVFTNKACEDDCMVTKSDLSAILENLKTHFDTSAIPSCQTDTEVLETRLIHRIYEELEEAYLRKMDETLAVNGYKRHEDDKLKAAIADIKLVVCHYIDRRRSELQIFTEKAKEEYPVVQRRVDQWFDEWTKQKVKELEMYHLQKKDKLINTLGMMVVGFVIVGAASGGVYAGVTAAQLGIKIILAGAGVGGFAGAGAGGITAAAIKVLAESVDKLEEFMASYRNRSRRNTQSL